MADLPGEFLYGTVKGRIITAVKDSADADTHPDSVAANGTISFIPSIGTLVSKVSDTVILLQKISVDLDSTGYFEVELVATTNSNLSPESFEYFMEVSVGDGAIPSVALNVPAGSITDIATVYRAMGF